MTVVEPKRMVAPPREPSAGRRTDLFTSLVTIGVFAAFSLWASIASTGFLEADGCTHYLYARFALQEPHFLVNVWGRPLFTALYALPAAWGGLAGAHVLSLVLAVACGLVAMAIARAQGYRRPVLALVFTLAQPLVFLHSFSELTELPFAVLVGVMFLAYQRRQWLVMALLAGLGPLARPEGFGFVLLAAAALVAHRRWWWLPVLCVPLVLWNHAGWVISGSQGPWWRWLPSNWPWSQTSMYERGHVLHFVALLPAVASPFVFPATCAGVWRCFADRPPDAHVARYQRLIAVIPLLILSVHSLLYATGKMASSGELRYMLVVAPFWGLLSARGWEWAFERFTWRHPLRWAGAASLAVVALHAFYRVVPLSPTDDYVRARRFVEWYRGGPARAFPRLGAAQPTVYFFMDMSPTDRTRSLEFHRGNVLEQPPPSGTLLVWDPVYSLYNSDSLRSIPIEDLLDNGWIEMSGPDVRELGGGWRVLRSPEADGAGGVGR